MKVSLASVVVMAMFAVGATSAQSSAENPAAPAPALESEGFRSAKPVSEVAGAEPSDAGAPYRPPGLWKGIKAATGDLGRAASAIKDETVDGFVTVVDDIKAGHYRSVFPDMYQATKDIADEYWDGAVTMKDTIRDHIRKPAPPARLRRRAAASRETLDRARDDVEDEVEDAYETVKDDLRRGRFRDVVPDVLQGAGDVHDEIKDGAKDLFAGRLRRRAHDIIDAYKNYNHASDDAKDAADDIKEKFEDSVDDFKHDLKRLRFDSAVEKAIQATKAIGEDIEGGAKKVLGATYFRR